MEQKESRERRKGKSMLHIADAKKRQEPLRKDGSVYVVPKGERKIFHLEVENPFHNVATGKKLSTPHIVKLDGIKEYRQFVINVFKSGYQYDLLHDPRPYMGMTASEIKAQDESYLEQAGRENRKKK